MTTPQTTATTTVDASAHHTHIITLGADGRITKDVVFCGGRWDASLLAQMAESAR
ncbi:MAG TPA: hypothetical protein VF065_06740 [Ilumatobacter sp.]